jgi:hypothetical protein
MKDEIPTQQDQTSAIFPDAVSKPLFGLLSQAKKT